VGDRPSVAGLRLPQIRVKHPTRRAWSILARTLCDEVPHVRHQHVSTEPPDHCSFAVLPAATTSNQPRSLLFRRELLRDRNPFAAKVATKHMGMDWVGKAPNHVFPHSRLSRRLVRSIGHFTRAAKLVHMVEHGTHRARRNTDDNTVGKIAADPQHTACHWLDAPLHPQSDLRTSLIILTRQSEVP
jgi:hypothetical protein